MAKAAITYSIPVSVFREGDYFVAYSPVLDLATSAKNFELAKKRFLEAVEVFFEELLQKGTLDEVLASLGWRKVRKTWQPPTIVAQETEKISVPLTV